MKLVMTDLANISPITTSFRAEHRLGSWLHTQAWIFDGGDAIVAPVGTDAECVVFLRIGPTVTALRAVGLVGALRQSGVAAPFSVAPAL